MARFDRDTERLVFEKDGSFVVGGGRGGGRGYVVIPLDSPQPSGGSGIVAGLIFVVLLFGLSGLSSQLGTVGAPSGARRPQPLSGVAEPQSAGLRGVAVASPQAQAEATVRALAAARSSASAPLEQVATGELLAYEQAYRANLLATGHGERWTASAISITAAQLDAAAPFFCATVTWEVALVDGSGATASSDSYSAYERYELARDGAELRVQAVRYLDAPCTA